MPLMLGGWTRKNKANMSQPMQKEALKVVHDVLGVDCLELALQHVLMCQENGKMGL